MTLIAKGTRCSSKLVFARLLRKWHQTTKEETVGDKARYPGVTPWVFVETSGHVVKVHADTTREAITRYLALASELGEDLPWKIGRRQRGTLNKICIEPNGSATKGLFLYTVEPLDKETSI